MIKKALKMFQLIINNLLILFFWLFPINKKKIFISNYYGKGYGDNAKYIVEELLKNNANCKIVWAVQKNVDISMFPKQIILCRYFKFLAIFHLATSKIWIDNCRKPPILKRKKQIYIQTWHGFALKRIEKDVAENLGRYYVHIAKKDSKMINLIISDSVFMTQIYRHSFWYKGKIVEWGAPRNDVIVNNHEEIKEKVYRYFNLSQNKKIVLYAPTFRKDGSLKPYSIDYQMLKQSCEHRFGGEFVALVRLHPNIVNKSSDLKFKDGEIINATFYPDLQELLMVADICITDYSSLMFDFALSKKPCFQFATDIEEYKQDRNFYFEIDKLPFPLSKSNMELRDNIFAFKEQEYENKLFEFYKNIGMVMDGKSSQHCAEYILKTIN